jgi:hypothetical protein
VTVSLSLPGFLSCNRKPRKDAAVHVSLSSDEIVKQLSRAKTLRSHKPPGPLRAPRKPSQTQSLTSHPCPPPPQKAKTADTFPPPPLRKGEQDIEIGHNQPNALTSGVTVGGGRVLGASPGDVKWFLQPFRTRVATPRKDHACCRFGRGAWSFAPIRLRGLASENDLMVVSRARI